MPTRAHPAEAAVERRPANVRRKAGVRAGNGVVRRALTEQWIGIHEITSPDGGGCPDGQRG